MENFDNVLVIDADGTIDYGSFSDRPLVINFFASWCPNCVAEMPAFERVHASAGQLDSEGLVVLVLAVVAIGHAHEPLIGQVRLDRRLAAVAVLELDVAVLAAVAGLTVAAATLAILWSDGRASAVVHDRNAMVLTLSPP